MFIYFGLPRSTCSMVGQVDGIDRLLFVGLTSLISFRIGPMIYGVLAAIALIVAVMVALVLSSLPTVQHLQTKLAARLAVKPKLGKAAPSMLALADKSELLYG